MSSRSWRVIPILAAACVFQPAFGQGRGSGGGAPPGGTGNPGGSTGNVGTPTGNAPNLGTTSTNTTNTQQQAPPIFLSGRVLLEDGTPPTEPVTIERICNNGSPRAEGYTDSKGYFGIQIGNESTVFQDASESSDMGNRRLSGSGIAGTGAPSGRGSFGGLGTDRRLMNCDLRAKLAGFRSQLVSLANHRALDNPDIGVILLHREGAKEEGSTVSAISLAAPKDARKAYEKAMEALKKQKPQDAVRDLEKAVELYPQYATAWCQLGKLQAGGNQPDAAKTSFEVALKADPKYLDPYLQLSILAVQAKRWPDVVQITDRALKLDSFDYPQLFFFNAVANYNTKNIDAAERSAKQAERLDSQHTLMQNVRLLGLIYARKGDLPAASEQFRTYLKLAPNGEEADATRADLQRLERLQAQRGQ